jgi:type IV secretory pathway protease TraF
MWIAAAILAIAKAAAADPLPIARPQVSGSCPFGYVTSGNYCVPSQGASAAVPKPSGGTCPRGWTSSGSYCLRSGR